jgi:DNA-binding beta-propeller fold protein YncE
MGRWLSFCLLLCATVLTAQEAPIPSATELPGRPFAIKKTWVIGGAGNWDYLTLDPVARQLFVTHQTQVQVVDLDSGAVVGSVSGFQEAHAVVLDPDGNWGYVSDGRANAIRVFNRRSFEVESVIDAGCSPRSLVFEPQTQLLFAVCGAVGRSQPASPRGRRQAAPSFQTAEQNPRAGYSHIVAIDPKTRRVLADVMVPADLRNARADGEGLLFVTVGATTRTDPRNGMPTEFPAGVARIDAAAVAAEARRESAPEGKNEISQLPARWEEDPYRVGRVRMMRLDPGCGNPQGLDLATRPVRLFVGCSNQELEILNADTGVELAMLTTGPGTDAVAYDPGRDLLFTANGGGYGSLTIVRRHVTDTYNVIQNLPTLQRARTMAVDPSTGDVYVVTTLYGANLKNPPFNGIGTLKLDPIDGSFRVLEIAN